ncbi:MAG: outer membrane beta-barrel protein [Bacteroidota bacterium]
MKKLRYLLGILICFAVVHTQAQEEEDNSLKISGSVDTYFKYDFNDQDGDGGIASNGTSFADQHNSVSLGMVNLILEKTFGKATFVGDVSVGPRSSASIGKEVGIQNLYISYAFTDDLTFSMGYMGTFVGYEVISPTANFNYTTSYLFTNGPFQNAGLKLEYAISDKVGVMVGLFNRWNAFDADDFGLSDFGAQLSVSPVEGWDAYLNFITGPGETEVDLTTTFQASDDFLIGLNAAIFTADDNNLPVYGAVPDFAGVALYLNYSVSDAAALGLRYEYFSTQENEITEPFTEYNVNAVTFSANLGAGPLTFIPEIRLDSASEDIFSDGDGDATGSTFQALLAAVFAF